MVSLNWKKLINKFLLNGDKFVLELHLEQPRFTDSACGPFLNTVKENLEKT